MKKKQENNKNNQVSKTSFNVSLTSHKNIRACFKKNKHSAIWETHPDNQNLLNEFAPSQVKRELLHSKMELLWPNNEL